MWRQLWAATAANNPTARIWNLIFAAADGLITDDDLCWMPAHKARCQIGQALRSDGRPISALDWLRNMVVDKLAKSAAKSQRLSTDTKLRMQAIQETAAFWRRRLGRVTHASQNLRHSYIDETGALRSCTRRDSDGKPSRCGNFHPEGNQPRTRSSSRSRLRLQQPRPVPIATQSAPPPSCGTKPAAS